MPTDFLFTLFLPETEIYFPRMATAKSVLISKISIIFVFSPFLGFLHFLNSPRVFKSNRELKKIKTILQHISTVPLGLLGCLQLMDRGVADGAVTWYSTFIITQAKMPSCQAVITGKGTAGEQRCRSWVFLKGCSRGILSILAATFTMNTYTSVFPFWPFIQQIYSYLHYFPAVHTSSNF